MIYILLFFLSLCYSAPFSLDTAKQTIFLAYASYCGNKVDQNYNCYWCQFSPGLNWVGNFGDIKKSYFGFVGYHESNRTIYVVFRGTDNIKGWIDDLTFIKVPYPGIPGAQVHSGIYNAYLKVQDQVRSLYFRALSQCSLCNKVIITGHSLGAGLALFAAMDMRLYANRTMYLYNYGSPRIGNRAFSDFAGSVLSIWRVTRDRDPVPHLPLKIMGYNHESTEIFNRNGYYIQCSGSEDPNCSDSIKLTNAYDHGLYMDVKIYDGIPKGCLYNFVALEDINLEQLEEDYKLKLE
jgi:hypothetical protein